MEAQEISKDKKYWLDEYGQRQWKHNTKPDFFALRSYHWVDRIIFIDESEGSRKYKGEMSFTEFAQYMDVDWTPVEPNETNSFEAKSVPERNEMCMFALKQLNEHFLTDYKTFEEAMYGDKINKALIGWMKCYDFMKKNYF